MSENLKRAKELLSHKFPNASDAEILGFALQFLLAKTDPLRKEMAASSKPTSATASRRVAKHVILNSANGSCSYKDPVTGRVCGSRFQLELDHIIPKALGGTNDAENLRLLCRQHNLHVAEKIFGRAHMDRFRRPVR